ncbi:MAG: hypothetical protein Q9219_006974 [cf. Caloplaca sp. 3 TL-2023]
MWISLVASVLFGFFNLALAVPASNHIPTSITQETAANQETNSSTDNALDAFDKRFQVPGTDTVLWISEGKRVDLVALRILLYRVQLDLNMLIGEHTPQGIPGNPNAPKYSFLTRTPGDVEGYFFMSAFSTGGLTYGLCNETLAGLKIYLLQKQIQAVFEVDNRDKLMAFGGVAIGPQAGALQAASNDTAVQSNLSTLPPLVGDEDVSIRCSFGSLLPNAAILQVLSAARNVAADKTRTLGPDGYLPGDTGRWKRTGHLGAEIEFLSVAPHRLTWQVMSGTVEALTGKLIESRLSREAQCSINVEGQVVGTVFVREKDVGTAVG